MNDLRDLYQEMILDHGKNPRNHRRLARVDREARGHNPLCGDRLTVYLAMDGERIADVAFQGSGCAISQASASILTETVKGKSRAEAEALFGKFHDLVTGKDGQDADALGKLAVFAGVREFPIRVKCATLSWHTLKAALDQKQSPATTE